MEIERKFLLKKCVLQEILDKKLQSFKLAQYYVNVGDEEERYRKQDNLYFHTIKKRVDGGLQRDEIETMCTENDFESNISKKIGNIIEKERYVLQHEAYKIEVDVYNGILKGLIIGEVEFQTKEEAELFNPPDFFDKEVTWDKRYKNQYLAINGLI